MRKLVPLAAAAVCAACSSAAPLELVVTPSSIAGDGTSPITVTLRLNSNGSPTDGTVHLTVSAGRIKESTNDPQAIDLTVSGGAATATVIPPRKGRGTIDLVATSSVDGQAQKKTFSVQLVPAGGLAHGLTFTCQKQNIGAFVTPREPLHVLCSAQALDANNQVIPNASIETMAEAGHLDWVTDESGNQQLVYTVKSNDEPPADVLPIGANGQPGDCSGACQSDPNASGCIEPCWIDVGGKTRNPRDGLVTLVVAVPGAKAFDDRGEPYVDADDNGQRDPGEPFIDYNGNGKYDPPDGSQKERMIWRALRIVWSGDADVTATVHGSKFITSGTGKTKTVTLRLNDQNYNTLAADGAAGADNAALSSASCSAGGTISIPSGVQLEQKKPGIKLLTDNGESPAPGQAPGGIDGPGFASAYRVGSDYPFQASIDAAGNVCSLEAAISRDYDPGVVGLFDSTGELGSEQVSGSITF